MANLKRIHQRSHQDGEEVAHIELFFDLIFVFALIQITESMADDTDVQGVARGMLLLSLLWWSWVGYAWLGNVMRPNEVAARVVLLAAMGVMFLIALAIPEAFVDRPSGVDGPVLIALCYLVFRVLHIGFFWIVARNQAGLRGQLIRFAPSMVGGTVTLLIASQFEGWVQIALWAVALTIDYLGTWLGGASGWMIRSSRHFAERHALILIVALGESVIATGFGVGDYSISWPVLGGSLLGLALTAGLWWTYFDSTTHTGARALVESPESDRARLARDAYSFIHLPIFAGVVLVALGVKKALTSIGDAGTGGLSDPLATSAVLALLGGVAIYLTADIWFSRRIGASISVIHLFGAGASLLAIPAALALPTLATLGLIVSIVGVTVAAESVRARRVSDRDLAER